MSSANPAASRAAGAAAAQAPARQRVAKLMARVGLCSRRDAEAWILAGRVSVNGEVLTSPARDVGPDDSVLVDGEPLPTAEPTRLFLFHKPRGLVTSDHDPDGRPTVADHLRETWPDGPRTVTIGRLDINTEGLLLLTNDGGLARVLELPQTGWVRRYRVRAKGETDQARLDALAAGVTIDGVDYAGIEAKLDRSQGANCWMTLGLREGKNREVKRVLESLGLEVNRLIRLSFGPFQLLDLPEGTVREVAPRILRDQLGEKLAQQAGATFAEIGEAAADSTAAPTRRTGSRDTDRPPRSDKPRANNGRAPRRADAPGEDRSGRTRRPERGSAEPAKQLERPQRGARKHVSILRATGVDATTGSPRRRVERSDTTDRRDRTVAVERLVTAPSAVPPHTRPPRTRRDDHLSPSAAAKRERTARSGGLPGRRDNRRDATSDRSNGDAPRRMSREVDRPRDAGRGTGQRPARRSRPESDDGDAASGSHKDLRSAPRTAARRDEDQRRDNGRATGRDRDARKAGGADRPTRDREGATRGGSPSRDAAPKGGRPSARPRPSTGGGKPSAAADKRPRRDRPGASGDRPRGGSGSGSRRDAPRRGPGKPKI